MVFLISFRESMSKNVSGSLFLSQRWPNPRNESIQKKFAQCWKAEGEILLTRVNARRGLYLFTRPLTCSGSVQFSLTHPNEGGILC